MMTFRELNIGEFQECEYEHYFTYRKTDNLWAIEHGFMHEVDVGDCQVRFARVLKTVAYICTDEDAECKPVYEIWKIKKHNLYNKE